MRRNGPVITLLAGLALAIVLLIADLQVKSPSAYYPPTPVAAATTATTPASAPVTSAAASPGAPAITYAGYTNGNGAGLAISIHNGQVIAYVCDGRSVESWLQGTAAAGALSLTGTHGGKLTGGYSASGATGTVSAGGHSWTFSLKPVFKPYGLYRAVAAVANARIVAGWVVLSSGLQVGIVDTNGDANPSAAPTLDVSTGTAIINGTQVTAVPVDAAAGL